MSGGSFNYLFCKDAEDLLAGGADEDLERMGDLLAAEGFADAAEETHALRLELRAMRARVRAYAGRLSGVWRAGEWLRSGDSGREVLEKAVGKYRGEGS